MQGKGTFLRGEGAGGKEGARGRVKRMDGEQSDWLFCYGGKMGPLKQIMEMGEFGSCDKIVTSYSSEIELREEVITASGMGREIGRNQRERERKKGELMSEGEKEEKC